MDNTSVTKICKRCGRELPVTMFYKNYRTKDGLQQICIDCTKQDVTEGRIKKQAKKYMEYIGKNAEIVFSELPDEFVINELKRRGYTGELTKSISVKI